MAPTPADHLRIAWLNQWDPMNPLGGGVERTLGEVGKRLASNGHDLTVISERHKALPASRFLMDIRLIDLEGDLEFTFGQWLHLRVIEMHTNSTWCYTTFRKSLLGPSNGRKIGRPRWFSFIICFEIDFWTNFRDPAEPCSWLQRD